MTEQGCVGEIGVDGTCCVISGGSGSSGGCIRRPLKIDEYPIGNGLLREGTGPLFHFGIQRIATRPSGSSGSFCPRS